MTNTKPVEEACVLSSKERTQIERMRNWNLNIFNNNSDEISFVAVNACSNASIGYMKAVEMLQKKPSP